MTDEAAAAWCMSELQQMLDSIKAHIRRLESTLDEYGVRLSVIETDLKRGGELPSHATDETTTTTTPIPDAAAKEMIKHIFQITHMHWGASESDRKVLDDLVDRLDRLERLLKGAVDTATTAVEAGGDHHP